MAVAGRGEAAGEVDRVGDPVAGRGLSGVVKAGGGIWFGTHGGRSQGAWVLPPTHPLNLVCQWLTRERKKKKYTEFERLEGTSPLQVVKRRRCCLR